MITLITIVLLTIMTVAYLTSSSLDQATARAFANNSKAELAAKTAVNTAMARLVDNFSTYNDSATTWEKVNQSGGTVQYQGTTLYYRDRSPEANTSGVPVPLHALPLISGATPVLIPTNVQTLAQREATLRAALPTDGNAVLDDTNSFNLNHARSSADSQGMIGAPYAAARPDFRAQWVNQTNSDGKVTSRFAYWMEDESFKANVNLMGVAPRGAATVGDNPSQMALQAVFKGLNDPAYDTTANSIYSSRSAFPGSLFFEYPALDQAVATKPADTSKFESTIFSGGLNLSRTGSKRVNLNKVVASSTVPVDIRKQLDQIIRTIKYQSPLFAQRFYRVGSNLDSIADVSAVDQVTYLNKIAANVRDYMDTDSQPTVVNNDPPNYTIRLGSPPAHPIETSGGGTSGPNEVIAIGKEAVPFVQEYVLRVRENSFSPRTGTFATYNISIDHYVEFWNISNRDIPLTALGSNPFLLIADQFGWDAGGLDNIPAGPSRDIKLPLSNATNSATHAALTSFPAGSVTVITTDPQPLSTDGTSTPVQTGPLTPDLTRVFYIPITPDNGVTGLRTYSGRTQKKSGSELRLSMIGRPTASSTDYETEVVLGNDLGILESAWGAGAITSNISINIDTTNPPENRLDTTKYHFRGGSLRGNSATTATGATTGDPRTNAEQLTFNLNGGPAGNTDKTRYSDVGLDSSHVPGSSTLGAANANFVLPSKWPDYSSSTPDQNSAPAVVANTTLTSIGQLGDIFDPVRIKGDSGDITLSRSGGRTLGIGQPNAMDATNNPLGLWDGYSNSPSREWTAWRLADMFTTSDSVQLDGRVNLNGVVRDGGIALRAALYNYVFQDPQLGGAALSDAAIQKLIDQLKARVANDGTTSYNGTTYPHFVNSIGPLAERGELSEMPIFNTGTDLTGQSMTTSYDRGREELFRRLTELTTTRGNIFTVYAVGQAIIPPPTGSTAQPIVASTSQTKVTFRVDPVWSAGTPTDPFDPTANPNPRFTKPDRYAVKILYAGD